MHLRNSQKIVLPRCLFKFIITTAFNCLATLFFECYCVMSLSQFVNVRLLRVL